jgi:hypothetical protein
MPFGTVQTTVARPLASALKALGKAWLGPPTKNSQGNGSASTMYEWPGTSPPTVAVSVTPLGAVLTWTVPATLLPGSGANVYKMTAGVGDAVTAVGLGLGTLAWFGELEVGECVAVAAGAPPHAAINRVENTIAKVVCRISAR